MIGRRFLFGLLAATPLAATAKPAAANPVAPVSIWRVDWQPTTAVMDLLSQHNEALVDKLWLDARPPNRSGTRFLGEAREGEMEAVVAWLRERKSDPERAKEKLLMIQPLFDRLRGLGSTSIPADKWRKLNRGAA